MIVEGVEIPAAVIDKTAVWAVTANGFTCSELEGRLIRYGADAAVTYRAADRILQKWKKDGKIAYRNKKWHWQGGNK